MGCSATKNVYVEPLYGNGDTSNGHVEQRVVPVSAGPSPHIPPLEGEDIEEELLETAAVNNIQKGPNGLSFEIAFEEENADDSIIRGHPPKRLQNLEERPRSHITLNKLQEKLEEAEARRQQILALRIQSAKHRNNVKRQSTQDLNSEDDPDHLMVPSEDPPHTPKYHVSYT